MEYKKPAHLQEVEDDAVRITQKRFRDQEEERVYQASKAKATKVQVSKEAQPEPEVVTKKESK